MLVAVAGGLLAGIVTAYVHLRFRINTLLAGILVMTILYRVNLRILGQANLALLSNDTVLSILSPALVSGVGQQAALFGGFIAIVVQTQGFADVQMGFGVLITGLAAVIIGEALVGRQTIGRQLIAPVLGSVLYHQLVASIRSGHRTIASCSAATTWRRRGRMREWWEVR